MKITRAPAKRSTNCLESLKVPNSMFTKASDVRGAVDKDSGEVLFDVKLPHVLRVVKESVKRQFLEGAFADTTINAFRSVDSFYDRLAKDTIGITRQDIRDF